MSVSKDSDVRQASAYGFELGKEVSKRYQDEKLVMNVLCGFIYMLILEEKITAEQGVMTVFEVAKNCMVDLQTLVDLSRDSDISDEYN